MENHFFKRKLTALGYSKCDNFNVNDENQFKELMCWLEDQKIRHYKIEDREALNIINSSNWQNNFKKYLSDISYPFDVNDKILVTDWCLTFALRLQYEDNYEIYEEDLKNKKQSAKANFTKIENAFDTLDLNSEECKNAISQLADKLKIPNHPNHLITLKAISIYLKNKQSKKYDKNSSEKSSQMTLENIPLGFDTGNKQLNRASKLLRLLFIQDLRTLQNNINQVLVSVQSITANPKTDTSLGKVGR